MVKLTTSSSDGSIVDRIVFAETQPETEKWIDAIRNAKAVVVVAPYIASEA